MIRFNKIISMGILGAMVCSIIPAEYAGASVNLETVDGTINNAQAFMNGTYIFDGYRNEDQESAVYFFNGKDDVEIEDVDNIGQRYGMNYINFKEDEVLFNLATGQVSDDIEDDIISKVEVKVKSLIRKADRYSDTQDIMSIKKIAEDTFGSIWYECVVGDKENTGRTFTIYMNDSGKYVDSSETLDIVYYDEEGNKIEFDTYDDIYENDRFSVASEETLMMDAENIYKVIAILDHQKLQNGSSLEQSVTTYALKISMEQGDKEDGAYIPKKVISYETYDLNALQLIEEYKAGRVHARVNGNSLYIIETDYDDESITVERYKLRKIKDDKSVEGKTLDKRAIELDEDFDDIQDEDMIDYDIDLYGNLWVLQKGKIKKMTEGKLETVYTVDRSINKLSVFAENSLIAWSTDTDIYSTVTPKSSDESKVEDKTEASTESKKEEVSTTTAGWIKNENGTWSYKKADGNKASGWIEDNGTWYYLDVLGVMQTGWFKDSNGKWYYLNQSGAMAYNTVIDGCQLGADGAWIQ